ncbi:MAG TPA: DUF2341 domain-containing protein [Steroidobacteraceae bacterium]|nr:DUF2341 domain-containing protein [Steroidobacteraceae bacterium]
MTRARPGRLLPALLACVALLALAPAAWSIAPPGQWWDANYAQRVRVRVAATTAVVNGYSVQLTLNHSSFVTAGDSLASGNDVRILYWTGSAWSELDRVVDYASSWNSATTKLWFRAQAAIGANASDDNYYVYYGNAAAGTPPTDPDNIFLMYDDFTGTTLDTAAWAVTAGSATVAGGQLTVNGASTVFATAGASFGTATRWESRLRLSAASPSNNTFLYWGASDADNLNGNYFSFRASTTQHSVRNRSSATGNTTTTNFTLSNATTLQVYTIDRNGTGQLDFAVAGANVGSNMTDVPTATARVRLANASTTTTQIYDWVRIRYFVGAEPTSTVNQAESYAPLAWWQFDEATWSNTPNQVLDASGNGHTMTPYGGAATAITSPALSGTPGTCRYGTFDGTNDYAETADDGTFDLTDSLTAMAWLYMNAAPSADIKSVLSKDTNFEFHVDTTSQLYWWWNGSPQQLTTTGTPIPAQTWVHVAVTYQSGNQRIYINGVQRATLALTGTLSTNNLPFQIGQDQGLAARFWNGRIDEVRIYSRALSQTEVQTAMNSTHPCLGIGVDHFLVGHDGYGIHCIAENITVSLRDAANNPYTTYTQQVTLDTQSGKGTWTLVSGGGTLTDAVANDGIATYIWATGQSTATFALSYREGATPINIRVYQTNDSTLHDDDTEGTLAWSPSGFTVTSAALSNPPPAAIPSFGSPQIAGSNFPVYLTAFGTTPTDGQCGVIEAYTGAKSLKFWSTYVNPGTGSRQVTINGTSIATAEAGSAFQAVTFTNGQAVVTAKYKDAGSLQIAMKDTTAHPDLPNGIRGGTGTFVSRPSTFIVTGIQRTDTSAANPGATTATGSVFLAAGRPFTATVTAYDAEGSTTPNFGKETPAESVRFAPNLVQPAGGTLGATSSTTGFTGFLNGASTGTDFAYSEVGIVTLTPRIADGDYLGAGDFGGTTTGNVGRFIPNDFLVAVNTPLFLTACSAGNYTYIGQPFAYAVAPVFTATARAFGGATTRNYTGAFFKMTNTTLTSRTYGATTGTIDTSGVPATTADPAIVDLANGTATLTFSSGTGIAFNRAAPVAPFDASIRLSINVLDSDGVAATANPVSVGGVPGIGFSAGANQRYGRIAFRNTIGSELINLPLPLRAEYYVSDTAGFITHGSDSCTTPVILGAIAYGGSLAAGETCALDSGSPGVSAFGCAAAAAVASRYRVPPSAGDFNLTLAAPGAGNGGTVTLQATVPAWLKFDWNQAAAGNEFPTGIATFGVFNGKDTRIYERESF